MQGKDNFFDHKKPIMIYITAASVLSVAIPVLLMFLTGWDIFISSANGMLINKEI